MRSRLPALALGSFLLFGPGLAALPRLTVVISVDQMRADFLDRFAPHFVEGGFRRFREGANFPNCFHRHGVTKTGPGHATILTGVMPSVHGIISNEWLLKTWPNLEEVNCVEDRDSPLVGLGPRGFRSPGGVLEAKSGRSPRHLLAPTIGDRLKERHGPAAKVYGVADKDRSAILMAGRKADGAYWTEEGKIVTSRWYRSQLPDYFVDLNAEQRVEKVFGTIWERLLPAAVYEQTQGADDADGESTKYGLGRTFPRRLDGGRPEVSKDFFEAFDHSPWNNELVAEMAQRLLVRERLGEDDGAPDLLAIGFSQTDKAGHAYGPDSHEVMDSFVRLDRTLAELFVFIDREVGLENCVFVLTGDHGAPPTPERRAAAGLAGGRVRAADYDGPVETALAERFSPAPGGQRWAMRDGLGFHLNPAALAATKAAPDAAAAVVAETLRRQPRVAASYTRAQMLSSAPLDEAGEAMRRSFHAERSPDVFAVLEPFFMDRTEPGVTHGQPYDYDQNVPLAWFGAGIRPGRDERRVGVDDIAPTLARLLGIQPPAPARAGRPLF